MPGIIKKKYGKPMRVDESFYDYIKEIEEEIKEREFLPRVGSTAITRKLTEFLKKKKRIIL